MKHIFLSIALMFVIDLVMAQDSTATTQQIDPSKPTNLYTQLNIQAEYTSAGKSNLIGTRLNLQYAINKDNLLFVELPILYNDVTKKFGIADVRVRYFDVVKRNITNHFIALAPFVDITAPSGSLVNGLGSGQWSLAAGVVGGFYVSPQFSFFPGVSYVYLTKSKISGVGLQFNGSYSFSKKTFVFINPTPAFFNVNGKWKANWIGDVTLNTIVKPNKFKMSVGYNPDFANKIYTYRIGGTLYF
jgi:hypothetical protein